MMRSVPPVRNRHLVRELDRGRIREMLLVVALVALMLLPLLAYVWNQMEWIRVGYETERLKRERAAQADLRERLRIEKAALESLSRVEREALSHLHLVPGEGALVRMDDPSASPVRVAKNSAGAGAAPSRTAAGVER